MSSIEESFGRASDGGSIFKASLDNIKPTVQTTSGILKSLSLRLFFTLTFIRRKRCWRKKSPSQ